MRFEKAEVVKHLVEVLKEMSEVEDVVITLDLKPTERLALDSGHGIPFALEMEDRLSIEIPPEVNPFVKDTPPPPCARTVEEIADLLIEFSAKQEELSNE